MKHRAMFRLMLRVVGLWFAVTGLPSLIWTGVGWGWGAWSGQPWGPSFDALRMAIGQGGQIALGVYLLTGPRWIVNLLIRDAERTCLSCGYSLRGLPDGGRCPECGSAYRLEPAVHEPDA